MVMWQDELKKYIFLNISLMSLLSLSYFLLSSFSTVKFPENLEKKGKSFILPLHC